MIGESTKRAVDHLAGRYAPILENAVRLLEDAQVLRKARRYASCTALAILSLEEVGKFIVKHDAFPDWISPQHKRGLRRYSHLEKQKLAAEALIWAMPIDEIRAFAAAANKTLVIVPIGQSSGPTMLDIISPVDKKSYKRKIASRLGNRSRHRTLIDLMAGKIEKIKQTSLYVDEDHHGGFSQPTKTVDRLTADETLKRSSAAINSTVVMLRRYSNKNRK